MPKLSSVAIEERKEAIEDAARELFIKQGFHRIEPNTVDLAQVYSLNYSTRDEIRQLVKLVFYNQAIFGSDAMIEQSMTVRVTANDGYTINSIIESIRRDEDFLNGRLGEIKKPTSIVWGK